MAQLKSLLVNGSSKFLGPIQGKLVGGATINQPINFTGNEGLPQRDNLQYILGIDAFAEGGTMKWSAIADVNVGTASYAAQAGTSQTTESVNWGNIQEKPSTFTPSNHNQDWSTITGKPSTFTPSGHEQDWSTITGKPSTFAPSSHTHDYLPLAGGTLTGHLYGQYLSGTWLQTTAATNSEAAATQIAVLHNGWVYYRTPSQILSDIAAVPLSGGTMTGPLTFNGGDATTASKIILDPAGKGQITDTGTSTILGFTSSSQLTVGHGSYNTNIRGASVTINGVTALTTNNIAGTANKVAKFTSANTIGDSDISDGPYINLGKMTIINDSGRGNYSDGLRINPVRDNAWAITYYSAKAGSVDGTHDGGWLVGRMGAAGGVGAVGDFSIEHNNSSAKGLTIHKTDASVSIHGPQIAISNQKIKFKHNTTDECLEILFS